MRNLFLPAFHAGVREGALSVMSAFHASDGIPSTASRFLLTQVLRDEWKFSGFVVRAVSYCDGTVRCPLTGTRSGGALVRPSQE